MSADDEAGRSAPQSTFRFDPDSGEVTGPAGTARLAPQPSSLLSLLMERRGEVVRRKEIRDRLWPAGGVDVDQGIAFALREIRKVLEAAGCDPGVVETIPRRGYRLVAEAHPSRPSEPSPPPEPGTAAAGSSAAARPRAGPASGVRRLWRRSRVVALSAIAVVLISLMVAVRAGSGSEPVLVVVEHRPESDELAGLATELGVALTTSLTDSLRGTAGIIGPTGAASLAGPDDVEGAREGLGACIVVSGNVAAHDADSVVVFTQMVRTEDRVHVWARVDTLPAGSAVDALVSSVLEGARASVEGC